MSTLYQTVAHMKSPVKNLYLYAGSTPLETKTPLYWVSGNLQVVRKGGCEMVYAVSDIHGCYDKYIDLLNKINFSPDDTLYVLGDVIDRGPDGFKIMLDMAQRPT